MGSVRTPIRDVAGVFHRDSAPDRRAVPTKETPVLDIVYVLGVIVLFALVGLIAKAVERLGPRAGGSAGREASGGEERG